MNISAFRWTQLLIKYGLAGCTLMFTIHCGCLILGMDPIVTDAAFGISWYWGIILCLALFALRLCWLSKALFLYCFFVTQCIVVQREVSPFGEFLDAWRLAMFGIGVILLTIVCLRFRSFNLTCCNE